MPIDRTPLGIFMEHAGLDEARAKELLEMIAIGSPDQYRRTIEGAAAALGVSVDWPTERRPASKAPLGPNDTHPGIEESE